MVECCLLGFLGVIWYLSIGLIINTMMGMILNLQGEKPTDRQKFNGYCAALLWPLSLPACFLLAAIQIRARKRL